MQWMRVGNPEVDFHTQLILYRLPKYFNEERIDSINGNGPGTIGH